MNPKIIAVAGAAIASIFAIQYIQEGDEYENDDTVSQNDEDIGDNVDLNEMEEDDTTKQSLHMRNILRNKRNKTKSRRTSSTLNKKTYNSKTRTKR